MYLTHVVDYLHVIHMKANNYTIVHTVGQRMPVSRDTGGPTWRTRFTVSNFEGEFLRLCAADHHHILVVILGYELK